MKKLDRRQFLKVCSIGAAGMMIPTLLRAEDSISSYKPEAVPGPTGAKGHVIVVGGGMGGATVAKYLRLWGGVDVRVTLIEPNPKYVSCMHSNTALVGQTSIESLMFGYDSLANNYGITVLADSVIGIDPGSRQVRTAGGSALTYDRLVLSPGIEFDVIPGLESEYAQSVIPHAWKAGAQTYTLRDQIKSMPAGGVFAMTIPLAPYRGATAPYERACLVADYLKVYKPGSKVIVLDANPAIAAQKNNFTTAFNSIHAGIIEYRPSSVVNSIDASARTLNTNWGKISASVINAIPPQRAGKIIAAANLNNATSGRFAGVDVLSYQSTAYGAERIHIIGDSCATTMPKAGHTANQEAKICADAVVRLLKGQSPDPSPVTSFSAYTPITMKTASWVSVVYSYDSISKTMKPVGGGVTESSQINGDQFEAMDKWFKGLMKETFS